MTTFEEWIATRLMNATSGADKVYPGGKLPEGVALPAINWFRVSTPRDHTQSSGDVPYPRFQISCWAKTHDEAMALGDEVEALFGGYRATVGDRRATARIEDTRGPTEDLETGEFMRAVDVVLTGGG